MLIIRPTQIEDFKKASLRTFEDDMVMTLREYAPQHCRGIGEENVRRVIRLGLIRSAKYGFTNRGPVRFYLQLMFVLGSYFDSDPQLPIWVAELLRKVGGEDQMSRAKLLHEGILDYRTKVFGPKGSYAHRAVRNFRLTTTQPLRFTAENIVDGLLAEMTQIYPERVSYVGREALKALVVESIGVASKHSLATLHGTATSCLLMFQLGHGCFEDPLYPWIFRILADLSTEDPDERAAKLEGKAVAYLELMIRRLDRS